MSDDLSKNFSDLKVNGESSSEESDDGECELCTNQRVEGSRQCQSCLDNQCRFCERQSVYKNLKVCKHHYNLLCVATESCPELWVDADTQECEYHRDNHCSLEEELGCEDYSVEGDNVCEKHLKSRCTYDGGCSNQQGKSKYNLCKEHERTRCEYPRGCGDQWLDDEVKRCEAHKCIRDGCPRPQMADEPYCSSHYDRLCYEYPDCENNKVRGHDLCRDHLQTKCIINDCNDQQSPDCDKCEVDKEIYCHYPGCPRVISDNYLCLRHTDTSEEDSASDNSFDWAEPDPQAGPSTRPKRSDALCRGRAGRPCPHNAFAVEGRYQCEHCGPVHG